MAKHHAKKEWRERERTGYPSFFSFFPFDVFVLLLLLLLLLPHPESFAGLFSGRSASQLRLGC